MEKDIQEDEKEEEEEEKLVIGPKFEESFFTATDESSAGISSIQSSPEMILNMGLATAGLLCT